MMNQTATNNKILSSSRMGANLPRRDARFQRHRAPSPYPRLAQELGYAKAKTARDNLTKPYEQVAITNTVLRGLGYHDKVSDLMARVFASVAEQHIPHWSEVIHLHNAADAHEDVAQSELIKNASDENLNEYISNLARDQRVGEILLAALEAERQRRREAKS